MDDYCAGASNLHIVVRMSRHRELKVIKCRYTFLVSFVPTCGKVHFATDYDIDTVQIQFQKTVKGYSEMS